MSTELSTESHLEIGHVLFTDIVGYSKLLSNEQRELFGLLNDIVRNTQQFRAADAAGRLVRIPTGDGMALVFFTSPDAPVRCAQEISSKVREQAKLPLRMGINSGPVDAVCDVNERSNVTGAGINIAQRVMDCGDAGHILLSKRAADDLAQYGEWSSRLHELGEVEIKHGGRIGLTNLCFDGVGNPALPNKVKRAARARRRRNLFRVGLASLLVLGGIGSWLLFNRTPAKPAQVLPLPEKSIAVLPFENMSAEKEDAFFADGIQDDVLTSLGKIKALTVIARTSVMTYRGAAAAGKLREIGQTLRVSHVVQGSVRRSANRVVMNVALVDTRDDRQLWSERYDRTVTDSIGLQGELATEIARALRATLNPEEQARLASKPTKDPEAYVLYLQAREKERTAQFSAEDTIAVDAIYDRAVALDPQFASAMARQSLWNSGMYRQSRSQERKTKAQALAVQALRVAPDLPEAHIALGDWFRLTERNYDAALKEFEIAARAMPNDPETLGYLGVLYRRQGRWREALENFHRVQELDPRIPHEEEAQTAVAVRDWKNVRLLYGRLLELAPDDIAIKANFATALMDGEGDFAGAWALLQTIRYPRYDTSGKPIWDDFVPRWRLLMLKRDYAGAEKLVVEFPSEEFLGAPGLKSMFWGVTAWAKGDQNSARQRFENVRPHWESTLRDHSDNLPITAHLGMLYACLGRKADAVRLSQRALDLLPANDGIERPAYLSNLALVYAWTGEPDNAVAIVEQLLTKPAMEVEGFEPLTLTILRSWKWDSLRGNPRFEKILAGPEPEDHLLNFQVSAAQARTK